jgi:triosephosphate isomerase
MHKTIREAESFAAEFPADADLYRKVEVVIFPTFTALAVVGNALRGTGIKMGAQNMHFETKGAFTGEISPNMLLDAGCSYVLLGHSERRHIFKETNEFINKKVKAALAHGLVPILCIGETLEERQNGRTEDVCKEQLLGSLTDIEARDITTMVVAYEPVWAIGTGVNATSQDAEETIAFIRRIIHEKYGQKAGESVRIQYGGSVKPTNAREYFSKENIDGALVGGASLEVDSLSEIIKSAGII